MKTKNPKRMFKVFHAIFARDVWINPENILYVQQDMNQHTRKMMTCIRIPNCTIETYTPIQEVLEMING